MKKLIKEPLAHFVVLGILLFLLYGLVNKKTDSRDYIVIDDFDLESIISSWEMQWKRLPTERELKNLIEQNIKQEIFYQEALKMNLDHNDEIIKRRLSQKMQFLSNDLATINEPTDEELMRYYDKNFKKYLTPYKYSFYQIIFSPDKRLDNHSDAIHVLELNPSASFEQMKEKGDKFPLAYFFEEADTSEISRKFGSSFSTSLLDLRTDSWIGPIRSGFGEHLVFITKKTMPKRPEFTHIRKDLIRDYEYENQQIFSDLVYKELRKKYEIEYQIKSDKFDASFIELLEETDQ